MSNKSMLIVKNCPDDDQLKRFIKHVESKFEWLYPVTLEFKKRGPYKIGTGYYDPNNNTVRVPIYTPSKHDLFDTVAHEIRHAQQFMHNLDLNGKSIEWDANGVAREWVGEFGETKYDAGVALDWCARYRMGDPSASRYPEA